MVRWANGGEGRKRSDETSKHILVCVTAQCFFIDLSPRGVKREPVAVFTQLASRSGP